MSLWCPERLGKHQMQIIRFLTVTAIVATTIVQARGEMLGQVPADSQHLQLSNGFLGAVLPSSLSFSEQYGSPSPGGGMMGFAATTPTGGQGGASVRYIPSITVSEMYDSNVFYAPKTPGLQREDFVTTVAPNLLIQRMGTLVGINFGVGAIASHYAVNSGLSYVGYNTNATIDVTQLARQLGSRVKSLQLMETFSFSPYPPSFLSGDQSLSRALDPDASTISVADQYIRGLQAFRVNTYTNMTSASGVYPVTAAVDFRAAYTYSFIRFGTPFVPGSSGDFFPSTNHLANAGPTITITSQDAISFNAIYQRTDYGQETFQAPGGSVGWSRQWNPQLRSMIMGGAQYIQVESNANGVKASQTDIGYMAQANLVYTRGSTIASFNYSAGVFPSYFVQSGPLLSNLVTVSVWHSLSTKLSVSASVNYSKNDPIKPAPGTGSELKFESVGSSVGFSYLIARNLALSLTETFGYFKGAGPGAFGSLGGGGIGDEFTRNAVMLSITAFGLY